MEPLFSFIIPVYNSEKYLVRCLDSVFAQTCKDFEVVIVDDCSSGDCAGIVKSYPECVRYTRHDRNRSLLQARITGGRLAKGKYLVSLDSDDFVGPGLLQALEDEIRAASEPDIVVYHMLADDGARQTPVWHNRPSMRISARDMLDKVFDSEVFWPMCGKAVRRDTYLKALDWLGVNADFYLNSTEDMCQMLPVLLCSQCAAFIEYPGYHYWHNPDSLSKSEIKYERLESMANQCQSCVDVLVTALNADGGHMDLIPKVRALIVPTVRWFLQQIDGKCDGEWNRCVDMLIRIHGAKIVVPIAIWNSTDFLCRYRPGATLFKSQLPASIDTIGILGCRASGGGAERATLLWARKMAAQGKRVVWMCDATADRKTYDLLAADGIVAAPIPVDQVSRLNEISNRIQEFKLDVVLLVDHWHEQMFRDLVMVKSLGYRAIVADHSSYFFPLDDIQLRLYQLREKYYPLADVVTVLSPANVSWYHAAGIRNVVYMPNLLTFDVKMDVRPRSIDTLSDVNFLVVGKICARKNAIHILEAFSILKRRSIGDKRLCRLTFLGRFETEAYERRVMEEVERLQLGTSVSFAGEHGDVAPFLERASVLLMASRLEGAPMVLMEAKSYALPTVMFSLPYVVATSEKDGVVSVPYGDTQAMADAMAKCVCDPDLYSRLSAAALASLMDFTPDRILERWGRLFAMVEDGGGNIDPLCEKPSVDAMLEITMHELSKVVPVMDSWWSGREKRICELEAEVRGLSEEASRTAAAFNEARCEAMRLANSRAYKIGRMITWPYRMVRNTGRCCRDNGLRYTLGRIPKKFANLRRRFFG